MDRIKILKNQKKKTKESPRKTFSTPIQSKGNKLKNQDIIPPKKTRPVINPARKDFLRETFLKFKKKKRGKKLKNGRTIKLNGG